ncbi:PGF-CTERM sorting domain-containing protein [Halogeometricum luteum]|uniref:PGF-CTERM sorting domain-containing protein n=1 Tax=Halogeometricum luteum TaxID=2950537 RepID=A0ABU2FXR3_9EURY|nr:PGF-CTERM sorting domain-containing protein [Halogeometricum sp. S3BR5-2]MDS0292849.1 PGF-CTERM sorting domain-containing protein [Halogeometricum sp. S3BR5-2]
MNAKSAFGLLVVALLSSSAFAGGVAGASNATLEIRPSESNAGSATYAATMTVEESDVGPLDAFEMHLGEAGVTPSSVPPNAVAVAGIDRGGDRPGTEVDVSVREDIAGVSVGDDGTVEVVFDGTNELRAGDELVVVVEGIPTPAPGEHTVPLSLNAPGERATVNATVTVPGDAGATPATTDETGTTAESDGADVVALTDSPVPGFGPVAAVVAVLAAAAFAARASRR